MPRRRFDPVERWVCREKVVSRPFYCLTTQVAPPVGLGDPQVEEWAADVEVVEVKDADHRDGRVAVAHPERTMLSPVTATDAASAGARCGTPWHGHWFAVRKSTTAAVSSGHLIGSKLSATRQAFHETLRWHSKRPAQNAGRTYVLSLDSKTAGSVLYS